MPTCSCDRQGRGPIVAGEQDRVQAERAQRGRPVDAARLDRVGHDDQTDAAIVDMHVDDRAALRLLTFLGSDIEPASPRPTRTTWPSTVPAGADPGTIDSDPAAYDRTEPLDGVRA